MAEITFSDILIKPQYSEITSRANVDLTTDMGKFKLKIPIISANMRHIAGIKMARKMAENGGMGILHRFNTTEEAVNEVKSMEIHDSYCPAVGVSIGVQEKDKDRFIKLLEAGARIFCIDVAHGHHILVKNMIKWVNENSDIKDKTLIVGNIATSEAAEDLQEWGADILKVGIGPGSCCTTRRNTGHGVPQITALQDVNNVTSVPIISDGGIKSSGDIAKALIFADAVMVGGMLAGSSETPGKVFRDEDGSFYKVYGGSASGENKSENGNNAKFVEGIMKTVPFQGKVKYILNEIKEGLQSALSYSGASNLVEYRAKAKWNIISGGGKSESKL